MFATIGLAFAARRDDKLHPAEEHLRWLLASARQQQTGDGHPPYLSMVLVELGKINRINRAQTTGSEDRGRVVAVLAGIDVDRPVHAEVQRIPPTDRPQRFGRVQPGLDPQLADPVGGVVRVSPGQPGEHYRSRDGVGLARYRRPHPARICRRPSWPRQRPMSLLAAA